MSVVLQNIVVGLLVVGCALFSVWRLATVRARLRMLEALGSLPTLGRARWLARLRERMLARSTAACGGCSTPGGASPNRTRGALRR